MSSPDQSTPSPRLGWMIWLLGALFYAYENGIQVSQSVMASALMRDFQMSAATLSQMASLYLWGYGLSQIPIGWLLDRFGVKRPMLLGIAACTLGSLAFACTHSIFGAALARSFIGLGSAFAALACMKIAALWFPPVRFSLLTGMFITIGMLGQMSAEAPLSLLVAHVSWRTAMLLIALGGSALFVGVLCIVRDRQSGFETPMRGTLTALRRALMRPTVWAITSYGMLMFTPFLVLSNLWGISYLVQALSVGQTQAAAVFSWMQIGFAIGGPAWGWYSDHIKRRKPILTVASCGALCTMMLLIWGPHNLWIMSVGFFLLGQFMGAFLPAFSLLKESLPSSISGSALGFMNTLNMLGAAVCMPLIGRVLDHMPQVAPGVFSVQAYQQALCVLVAIFALAMVCLCVMPETYATPCDESTLS